MRELVRGDRVKMKTKLMSGWKGIGTVICQTGDIISFFKDGDTPDDVSICMRWECLKQKTSTEPAGQR